MPLFSLFALLALRLWLCMAGERGTVARWWFFGVIAGNVNPRYAVAVLRMLLIVLVGTLYPMIYGLLGWDASPLARRILTARRYRLACCAGGDCAGDVCLWQTRAASGVVAHAGVLLFAAGIVVSSVSVRRSA